MHSVQSLIEHCDFYLIFVKSPNRNYVRETFFYLAFQRVSLWFIGPQDYLCRASLWCELEVEKPLAVDRHQGNRHDCAWPMSSSSYSISGTLHLWEGIPIHTQLIVSVIYLTEAATGQFHQSSI